MLISVKKIFASIILLQSFFILCFIETQFWRFQEESRIAYMLKVQEEGPYPLPLIRNESLLESQEKATAMGDENENISLPICPLISAALRGPIDVILEYPPYEHMIRMLTGPSTLTGGRWRPLKCVAHQRVAIIVPYRNRDRHLRAFLHNIHQLLRRQQRDYGIYIVEQVQNQTFNRAKLMNIGFVEASKRIDWDCFIFHDVDLLPENDHHSYTCDPNGPKRLVDAIDKARYIREYEWDFGGVSALTASQMKLLNGYSNDYWGWGGEDNDMSTRIELHNLTIIRFDPRIGKYKMMKHDRDEGNALNPCRSKLMEKTSERWNRDGLSNLKYNLMAVEIATLYTRFKVDLLERESLDRLRKEKICEIQ